MEAMNYEYLIRAVFKCGRTRRFGADADIFRGLERASVPFPGQKSVDQYKLGFKIGEVAAYLHTALYEVQEQYKDNKEFTSKIDKCLEYLYEPSLEDIDKLGIQEKDEQIQLLQSEDSVVVVEEKLEQNLQKIWVFHIMINSF